MQHYQVKCACGVCKRSFVVDIVSWGTPHQQVQAVTCEECAKATGGNIMPEGHVEELKREKSGTA